MGGLVEEQLNKALIALRDGDPSAVSDVEKTDDKVNELEVKISHPFL